MQKEVDVLENDTLGTVYFDKLFPLGVEAMIESVDLVREGKAPKTSRTTADRPTKAGAARRMSRSTGPGRRGKCTT